MRLAADVPPGFLLGHHDAAKRAPAHHDVVPNTTVGRGIVLKGVSYDSAKTYLNDIYLSFE